MTDVRILVISVINIQDMLRVSTYILVSKLFTNVSWEHYLAFFHHFFYLRTLGHYVVEIS